MGWKERLGGSEKKESRGDATAAQSRAMSVSARARGQLEPSHAHFVAMHIWRLNGEHSNANTVVDVDVDLDRCTNAQTSRPQLAEVAEKF